MDWLRRLRTEGLDAIRAIDPSAFIERIRGLELAVILAWLRDRRRAIEETAGHTATGTGGARRTSSAGPTEAAAEAPPDLQALWTEFVATSRPPRRRTRTPGEIARYAVERGWSAEAVNELTESYRDAVYGGRLPDEDRLVELRRVMAELERGDGS